MQAVLAGGSTYGTIAQELFLGYDQIEVEDISLVARELNKLTSNR
ncbi:MAG: hypothetical protein Fur0025_12290 [Oscillatoriaceae cyanobacterium]